MKNDVLLQEKLDYYAGLDSAFDGGFYVADLSGNSKKAANSELNLSDASNQIWFKEGLTRMNPGMTSVYNNETGDSMVSVSGMLDDIDRIRVLSVNLSLDTVNIIVNSSVSMKNAESLLIDKTDGTILVARDNSLVSTSVNGTSDAFLQGVAEKIAKVDYALDMINDKVTVMKEISGSNWILVSYVDVAVVTKAVNRLGNTLIIIALICLLSLAVASYVAVHIAVRPLKDLTEKIRAMSDGDFSIHISPKGNDEIADIQRSVRSFVHRMREMISDINSITENIQSQADSSSVVSGDMQGSSESQAESMTSLNETVDQFSISINEIAESATNLSGVVMDTTEDGAFVRQQIDTTVDISQKGRADMQRVSAAMGEIRVSIEDLITAINKVGDASHQITGIIDLIGNISEETSLLSLNASIEAARAGEAGKGFAVVAMEISKLADTTASSVENITELINEVDRLIADAVKQVGVSVDNINESGERIQVAVKTFDEIYGCIQAVEHGITKMINGIQIVNNVAMDVSAISQEQAASTALISETSEDMVQQANDLARQSEAVADGAKVLTQTSEELTRQMSKFRV